jgi:hypothetical protein
LHEGEGGLHLFHRHAQVLGQFGQGDGQVTGFIELVDQEAGDKARARGLFARQPQFGADLGVEMLGQRCAAAAMIVDGWAFAARGDDRLPS